MAAALANRRKIVVWRRKRRSGNNARQRNMQHAPWRVSNKRQKQSGGGVAAWRIKQAQSGDNK